MSAPPPVVRVCPFVQRYAWGKEGRSSKVFELFSAGLEHVHSLTTEIHNASDSASSGSAADPPPQLTTLSAEDRFSELWMGTHKNGPALALCERETSEGAAQYCALDEWIGLWERPGQGSMPVGLPFLFKVLSIAKPLSIQAHPDKKLAEQLHATQPHIYRDNNHKPELACALSPFEALCGFRAMEHIIRDLRVAREVQSALGSEVMSLLVTAAESGAPADEEKALRAALEVLLSLDDNAVRVAIGELVARVDGQKEVQAQEQQQERVVDNCTTTDRLAVRVNRDFPNDVGVLVVYLLNHVELRVGEALFLGPGVPHAYISGECVECMACSDNVVRAGLTPKLKDTSVLCDMLEYKCGSPNMCERIQVKNEDGGRSRTHYYAAPVSEFCLWSALVEREASYSLPRFSSTTLVLVESGSAVLLSAEWAVGGGGKLVRQWKAGDVFAIAKDSSVSIRSGDDGVVLYMCSAGF